MKKTSAAAVQADLRQEAAAIMDDDEIPVEETPVEEKEGKELDEKDMPVGEEPGVEYYLFERSAFYGKAASDGLGGGESEGVIGTAVNDTPIESKADVLKFCRSAEPGTYVLVKVMDELEVAPPKEANIVRSNPRLKKPRKAE